MRFLRILKQDLAQLGEDPVVIEWHEECFRLNGGKKPSLEDFRKNKELALREAQISEIRRRGEV